MAEIVTDGLLAYYNSKRGVEGNVWENISPNKEGEYNGEIYGTTTTEEGLYFDGVDDYVDIPQLQEYSWTVGEKTIEVVFEPVNGLGDGDDTILVGGETNQEIIGYRNGMIVSYLLSDDWDNYFSIEYPYNVSEGETCYIAVSYNPPTGMIKLYVNGSLVLEMEGTNNLSFNHPNFTEVTIGGVGYHNWNKFNGYIRSVRMYDRALTDEEIHQNYLIGGDVGLDS